MKDQDSIGGYKYADAQLNPSHGYLLPAVASVLEGLRAGSGSQPRLFDLGCGNGVIANHFAQKGWQLSGVDVSSDGIKQANATYPDLNLAFGSAYDDLQAVFGQFPALISLEVVEHVYAPRDYARTLASLLEPGGTAIISTPYHGYLKNLALAVSGKMDNHFTALWDHGHIKFWSAKTLTTLLAEAGLVVDRVIRVGRVPPLAKSMILIAKKPR